MSVESGMTDDRPMSGLTVRWSLRDAADPDAVAEQLVAYVRDTSHARFEQLATLTHKVWRMRRGEWFEGCYVFSDPQAREDFQREFTAGARDASGTTIVGAEPVLIEPCEVVAVAEGGAGFASSASYDPAR